MRFAKIPETTPLTSLQRVKRVKFILGLLGFLAIALLIRLSFLQVANKAYLTAQGNARTIRSVTIPSYRGLITDRRGTPIAVSTPVDSIWVNPKNFYATTSQLSQIAQYLNIPAHDIATKIKQQSTRGFVYLKRGLTPQTAQKINELNVPGLYVQREFRRYYPAGPITAQLIGFTNIDDQGQSGLELAFDEELKANPGKKNVLEDRMGHWIQDLSPAFIPRQGQDLQLSIDLRIQTLAYHALERAVSKLQAKSGTLVMIDVQSGEVLSMVSVPAFNPNVFHERQGENLRNRALVDLFEPGSTMKTFSMVSLLEHSDYDLEDEIDTSPGILPLGKHQVRDVVNFGKIKIKQILTKSSNVGLSKLITERPPEELIETFRKFGLGQELTYLFPGERAGRLPAPPRDPFTTATLSFGYSLTATPLQIAHAYATLANRGLKKPVQLFKLEKENIPAGEQVVDPKVAENVLQILTEVMNPRGTGRRARIKGYKTAGKTGTTRIVGPQGYDANRHNAFFVGITPVEVPRLATLVIIEEPNEENNQLYGGVASAPVYAEVVKGALHMLNVPPDNA